MRDDDRAGDGQAQPGAPRVAGPRRVEPHERLKDPPGVRGIDAGARVADGEHGVAVAARERQLDLPARRRVLHRVLDEVQRRATEGGRVADDARRPDRVQADGDVSALGQPGADLQHLHAERLEVDRGPGRAAPRGRARQQQQVLRQANQPLHLLEARAEDPAVLLGRPLCPQGDLDATPEGGERRPELVGGVGGEPPHLGEGALEPRQHLVQRLREAVELVARPPEEDAPRQVLRADPPRAP